MDPRVTLNRDGIHTIIVEPHSALAGFFGRRQNGNASTRILPRSSFHAEFFNYARSLEPAAGHAPAGQTPINSSRRTTEPFEAQG